MYNNFEIYYFSYQYLSIYTVKIFQSIKDSFIYYYSLIFIIACLFFRKSLFRIIRGNGDLMLEQYLPFVGLIIFGNIENLVLSSQGVVAGVNPLKLGIASIICVSLWLIIGTFGTQLLIDYVDFIDFIGGLAIFVLGLQAMIQSVRGE